MREIKFRAWDDKCKQWADHGDSHSLDDLYYQDEYYPLADIDFLHGPQNLIKNYGDRITVEQFTGLRDKNGNEIYEGDIVHTDWHWSKSEKLTQPVEYYSANGLYSPFGTDDWAWDAKVCEIIGNIHENPELVGEI